MTRRRGIFVIVLTTLLLSFCKGLGQTRNFDKQKWLTSSSYRYEVVDTEAFLRLEKMKASEIESLLGKPNFKENKVITYCLDIAPEDTVFTRCPCALIWISLDEKTTEEYRVNVVLCEPKAK